MTIHLILRIILILLIPSIVYGQTLVVNPTTGKLDFVGIQAATDVSSSICSANQILKKNAGNTAWECGSDNSTGGGLTNLDDVNSATIGAGRLLVSDTADFNSVVLSGDATLSSSGVLTIGSDTIGTPEISFISSATATSGNLLIGNGGGAFDSITMSGDCTIDRYGVIACDAAGASELSDLTDVNAATVGAGRLLVSDTVEFSSVVLSGDATLSSSGVLNLAAGSVGTAETSFISSATATAGHLLIGNGGGAFDSIALSGDATLGFTGALTITQAFTDCKSLESPVDGDDNIPFWAFRDAITVTDVYCNATGGGTIAVTLGDGTNSLEAITCDDDGAEDDGSIANGTFTSLEPIEVDHAAPSGTVDWNMICITYTQ